MASVGVALPEDSDVAQQLVERAEALAQRLNGRWVAFIICDSAERGMSRADLAMQRGGTVFVCEGEDTAETLIALAARERVDILILGAPERRRWPFGRGTVERVVRAHRAFDVVVVGDAQP